MGEYGIRDAPPVDMRAVFAHREINMAERSHQPHHLLCAVWCVVERLQKANKLS
jgi:hypothetical protein